MTKDEALELALESLLHAYHEDEAHPKTLETITAVKEALAKPEQEPVAYINIEERKLEWAYKYMSWDTPTVINLPKIPLYTTPPQRTWVGLTDDEAQQVFKRHNCDISKDLAGILARGIEAKLKENT